MNNKNISYYSHKNAFVKYCQQLYNKNQNQPRVIGVKNKNISTPLSRGDFLIDFISKKKH